MNDLLDHVEESARSHRLFRDRERVLVAVSGGVDSIVLLHVLHALSRKFAFRLTVAHLNHKLRGRNSDADERLVRLEAKSLKLPVVIERATVRRLARQEKISLEMAARKARHDFLARAARRSKCTCIALAHHADDQVELFFLRLFRGSGGEGLGGMSWRNPSPVDARIELVRPLLDLQKGSLRAFAKESGIRFREDASNQSLDIRRNRIRHELLPLLRSKYQSGLDAAILRVMNIAREEAAFVTEAALDWLSHETERSTHFSRLPVAVQRRSLQLQLLQLGYTADFELIERLRRTPNRLVSAGQVHLLRDANGIVATGDKHRSDFSTAKIEVDLRDQGRKESFGGISFRWQIQPPRASDRRSPPAPSPDHEIFDADNVGMRIILRHWQPGDRFQPIGMAASVKLQDFFTNQKVPRDRRRSLVVAVAANGEIFWVEGLRIGEQFRLTDRTKRCLYWRWRRMLRR